MALKRNNPPLAMFSMASLTDIIFLLLIFFMVTSTVIQPTALDVNLPQSDVQTQLKPVTEVYVDSIGAFSIVENRLDSAGAGADLHANIPETELADRLMTISQSDSLRAVAIYADESVPYGKVVQVLNMANRYNLRSVLATRPDNAPQR
ncbi:MAG: biopolymer transporter ExbD [Muribaculum sp.]|nr:biopolymer transporter ExbD [Muribaculum sp.]